MVYNSTKFTPYFVKELMKINIIFRKFIEKYLIY